MAHATSVTEAANKRGPFVLLLFLITFLQGIRMGGTPLPSSLALCALYVAVFNPRIPADIGRIMACVFLCIILISTRNSLQMTGTTRDFLYIGIVVESFLLTVCLVDMSKALDIKAMANIVAAFTIAQCALQILEWTNVAGFNNLIRPLLNYWDGMSNSSYGPQGNYSLRAAGSFGSPTIAGFVTYFMVRSVAILMGKRWIIYLSLIPLVVCGARTTLAVFILWEFVVPMFSARYRRIGIPLFALTFTAAAVTILFYPQIYENIFVINFFIQAYNTGTLATTDSIIYRVYGAQWALEQPLSQWIIGGMTAQQMNQFGTNFYTFDSEFIQRTMQYGLVGYVCFVVMNLCAGFDRKSWDWWFGVAMVGIGSLTNYIATSVIIFPFLILYNVCLRRAAQEMGQRTQVHTPPQQGTVEFARPLA